MTMFKPVFLSVEDFQSSLEAMNEYAAELKEAPAKRFAMFEAVGCQTVDDFLDGKVANDLIDAMPPLSAMMVRPLYETDEDQTPYTGVAFKNEAGIVTTEVC